MADSKKQETEPSAEVQQLEQPGSLFGKIGRKLVTIRRRWLYFGGGLLVLGLIFSTVQPIKFAAYNLVSDANTSLTVVDSRTGQPLSGVEVSVGSQSVKTNEDGLATLVGIDFGDQEFTISKDFFESQTVSTTVDDGNFELGLVSLQPTGTPVTVSVVDWLSNDPVTDYSLVDESGELSANSDDVGRAVINLPPTLDEVKLTVSAEGYQDASTVVKLVGSDGKPLPADAIKSSTVKLVAAGKHTFVSARSGNVALYESSLNGRSVKKIEQVGQGTSPAVSYSITPDGSTGILLAPMKNVRNDDNILLRELYSVDTATGNIVNIDEGNARFRVLSVDNNKVIYSVALNDSEARVRGKIKVYDLNSASLQTIWPTSTVGNWRRLTIYNDYSNGEWVFFQETKSGSKISEYGTVSNTFIALNSTTGKTVNLTSSSDGQVTSVDHQNNIAYITEYKWPDRGYYEFNMNTGTKNKIDNIPNIVFTPPPVASIDGTRFARAEDRDGKTFVEITIDGSTNTKKLNSIEGGAVSHWVGNEYFVVSADDGDYLMSATSGKVKKITDTYKLVSRYHGYYY